MAIQRAQLEMVIEAMDDLGKNRLPLPLTVRLHNARRAVASALNDRVSIQNQLVTTHLPEGRDIQDGVTPDDEGYENLRDQMQELYESEADVDLGEPITTKTLEARGDGIVLTRQSLAVLMEIGFVVDVAPELVPA